MNVLSYVNLIRKEIGLEEIEPASDGVCGFLNEREVAEYIGKKTARILFKEHNRALEEKYLKGELLEVQPVLLQDGGREGLLIREDNISFKMEKAYTVLIGNRYEIGIVGLNDCIRRVARVREMDLYEKYKEREDSILRRLRVTVGSYHKIGGIEYEYLGTYKKKIVMRKKGSSDIMYYNAEEVFNS